jgi:hypothetical protein
VQKSPCIAFSSEDLRHSQSAWGWLALALDLGLLTLDGDRESEIAANSCVEVFDVLCRPTLSELR